MCFAQRLPLAYWNQACDTQQKKRHGKPGYAAQDTQMTKWRVASGISTWEMPLMSIRN